MQININGITAQNCETDYGDYFLYFYPRDHDRHKVKQEIPNNYKIIHKEYDEGGELVTWFLEQK